MPHGIAARQKIFREDNRLNGGVTLEKNIVLRHERAGDRRAVEKLTYEAFKNAEHAEGTEALLARMLRGVPSFVPELDYVAESGGKIIGNIMYTRSKIIGRGGAEWETLTFGPLSVLPEYQRGGVGAALVRRTLGLAGGMGFRAVLIFGHEGYYPRFGFKEASLFGVTTESGENFPAFMALPLHDGAMDGVSGKFVCDPVFFSIDRDEADAFNASLTDGGVDTRN
jgi:predicted N-acetyltransferase YhbS